MKIRYRLKNWKVESYIDATGINSWPLRSRVSFRFSMLKLRIMLLFRFVYLIIPKAQGPCHHCGSIFRLDPYSSGRLDLGQFYWKKIVWYKWVPVCEFCFCTDFKTRLTKH